MTYRTQEKKDYRRNWQKLINDLLPEQINAFAHTLTRNQYLTIFGFIIVFLIILGVLVNRHWIKKESEAWALAWNETLEQT